MSDQPREQLLPRSTPIPNWLPAEVRHRLAGTRYTLKRLPESVRRRMRTPEKIKVSDHAAKYRVVTEEPHTGPWRHELAPHTVKIMDTFCLPHVREIWFSGVDQSGKTNTMLNCLHWAADVDPGNIFYLMPTEATGDKVTSEKLTPMIKESKRLKKLVSKKDADITLSKIKLTTGVTIRPAHANSASSMATFTAKHCFGDEVDKYPEKTGREADPITLIKKRNRLYKGRYKRFFASTPAQMFIYKGTMACVQVWEERHLCPHCGELFRPEGECLVIPDGLKAEEITENTEIYYSCTKCGAQLDDVERLTLLATPHWKAIKGADQLRPSRVGFLHRAWDCLDVPLHEIAAAWVAARDGGIVEKIAWANGYEAIDYEYEQQDRKEDFIIRLCDPAQPREVVPRDTSYLMIVADTQQIGFHYQVLAFGWGVEMPVTKIDHGFVESFANLQDLAVKIWQDADGKEYRCQSGWIDSGGGTNPARPKHSRTVEVYRFCRQFPFWRPIKGRRTMEQSWNVKRMDFYPSSVGKKVPIPGGLNLYTLNVTIFKDDLAGKLQIEPGGPGAICLNAGTTSDYAKQLCAEYRDDHGFWQCPKGKDNHQWDTWVYGLAAAEIIGIRNWRQEPVEQEAFTVYSKGVEA